MTPTLTDHLTELADTLDDLRRRFRQAAREEVARAVISWTANTSCGMSLPCRYPFCPRRDRTVSSAIRGLARRSSGREPIRRRPTSVPDTRL
jgi:hypothetical protein